MTPIYLDNNATTRIDPAVAEAMHACHLAGWVNPASQHQLGQSSRRVLERARDGVAALLGADTSGRVSDRLIWTSGGTEANNLALFGLVGPTPGHLLVSSLEHPSVIATADELARRGYEVERIAATSDGVVDLDDLRRRLRRDTRLVSVMLANNETGVIQPVGDVVRICGEFGVRVHCDAVQAVGKIPVNFRTLGVAAMSVTAHKLHGPVGVGALLLRPDLALAPQLFGGFQQGGLRPGTEAIALAVGFHKALEIWAAEAGQRRLRMQQLRDDFERQLKAELPDAVVHGAAVARLPHVTNISFTGLDRQPMLLALDMAGIACSTGSACASGSSQPSPVLMAMGLKDEWIASALRFSLSARTTSEDVSIAATRIVHICKDLRQRLASRKTPSPPRHARS